MKKSKKQKKVVVTGGSGFIGSHLVDALVIEGFDVHIIDIEKNVKEGRFNKQATYHNKDIRVLKNISPILKGTQYVFHLAALPRVQYSIEHPIETNEVNVTGMFNVLVAAKDAGVKRFIYSASSSAYGNQKSLPLREDMLADPLSPYGLQKYIGELQSRLFSDVYGLETVSLRYFNVYGARFDPEGAYALVIGKFLKQRKENKTLTITGDGKQTRDFTHVSDVVRANILAMKSKKVGNGEVINIGAGKNYSVNELADMIGGKIKHISPRIEPKHTKADIRKARKLLNWIPTISLKKGITELKNEFGI